MATRSCDLNRNESTSVDNLMSVENSRYISENTVDTKLSRVASVRALPPVDDCVELFREKPSPLSFQTIDNVTIGSDFGSSTLLSGSTLSIPVTPLYETSSLTYSYGTVNSIRIEPSPERTLERPCKTTTSQDGTLDFKTKPVASNRSSGVFTAARLARFVDDDIALVDGNRNDILNQNDTTSKSSLELNTLGADGGLTNSRNNDVRDDVDAVGETKPVNKKVEHELAEKLDNFFGESKPGVTELETNIYRQLVLGPVAKLQSTSLASNLNDVPSRGKKFIDDISKAKKSSAWSLAPKPLEKSPSSAKMFEVSEPSNEPSKVKSTISTWRGKVVRQFRRQGNGTTDVNDESSASITPLTFGVALDSCVISHSKELVPLVVEVCTHLVEELGLISQGIYRVPGHTASVNMLVDEINANSMCVRTDNERWNDINVVASLLKLFFRKLPDSLVTDQLYPLFIAANRLANAEKCALRIKRLLLDLPELNRSTLCHLARHLSKIANNSSVNKMDAHNLAMMFGPSVIRLSTENTTSMVRDIDDQSGIMKRLIENHEWYFAEWSEEANVPHTACQTESKSESGNLHLLASAESLVAMQKVYDAAAEAAASASANDDVPSGFLRFGSGRHSRKKNKANSGGMDKEDGAGVTLDREVELRRVNSKSDKPPLSHKSQNSPALSHVELARKVSMSMPRSKKINRRFTEKSVPADIKICHEQVGTAVASGSAWKPEKSWEYREEEPEIPSISPTEESEIEVKRYPAYNFVDTTIKKNKSVPAKISFNHNLNNQGVVQDINQGRVPEESTNNEVFGAEPVPVVRMRGRLSKDAIQSHRSKRYSEADACRFALPSDDILNAEVTKDTKTRYNVVIRFPEDRRYYVLRLDQPSVLFHSRKSARCRQQRVSSMISDMNNVNIGNYTSDKGMVEEQNNRKKDVAEYLPADKVTMCRAEVKGKARRRTFDQADNDIELCRITETDVDSV